MSQSCKLKPGPMRIKREFSDVAKYKHDSWLDLDATLIRDMVYDGVFEEASFPMLPVHDLDQETVEYLEHHTCIMADVPPVFITKKACEDFIPWHKKKGHETTREQEASKMEDMYKEHEMWVYGALWNYFVSSRDHHEKKRDRIRDAYKKRDDEMSADSIQIPVRVGGWKDRMCAWGKQPYENKSGLYQYRDTYAFDFFMTVFLELLTREMSCIANKLRKGRRNAVVRVLVKTVFQFFFIFFFIFFVII